MGSGFSFGFGFGLGLGGFVYGIALSRQVKARGEEEIDGLV
jgi:hypothetical protein